MRFLFSIVCIIAFTFSCKNNKASNLDLAQDLSDFQAFYERFHGDADYQLAHINFPLQGAPDNAANDPSYNDDFRWTKENWVINKPIDLEETGFKRSLFPLGEDLIIEKLQHESGGYEMQRRFSKVNGEWYLIFYAGLNPI
ncbi:MAG: hypothetical protein AAF242_10855 [Bacteroidota bacterium]